MDDHPQMPAAQVPADEIGAARETEALRNLIAETEAELRAAERRISELQADIARHEDAGVALRLALSDAADQAHRARAEADLADNRRALDRARRELEAARTRQAELARRLAELRDRLSALT